MKATQIALATAAAFALAGPALAAGDQQRDSTRSSQGSQQYDRSTGAQSSSDSMQNKDSQGTTSSSSGMSGDRASAGTSYSSGTVREVQQALKDKGIETGPVDGIFGPKTQSAVREFQQKEGIAATGRIDRQTLAALDVESSAMGTSSGGIGGSSSGTSNREGMDQRDLKGANPSPAPEATQAGKTGVPRSSQ